MEEATGCRSDVGASINIRTWTNLASRSKYGSIVAWLQHSDPHRPANGLINWLATAGLGMKDSVV
jgi:hypothetical protein